MRSGFGLIQRTSLRAKHFRAFVVPVATTGLVGRLATRAVRA